MWTIATSLLTSAAGFIMSKLGGAALMRIVKSPVTWVGAGALGIFIAYQAGNLHGANRATEKCRAAAVQAKLQAAQRDLEIQRKAAETASRERDALATSAAGLEGKVAEYEEELRKRTDRCVATDDDVSRLRALGK